MYRRRNYSERLRIFASSDVRNVESLWSKECFPLQALLLDLFSLHYRDLLKPRNVDLVGASLIVGREFIFLKMLKAKWIAPVVEKYNCKLYAVGHVEECCDLLETGFIPGKKDPMKAEIQAAIAGAMRPAYAKV